MSNEQEWGIKRIKSAYKQNRYDTNRKMLRTAISVAVKTFMEVLKLNWRHATDVERSL